MTWIIKSFLLDVPMRLMPDPMCMLVDMDMEFLVHENSAFFHGENMVRCFTQEIIFVRNYNTGQVEIGQNRCQACFGLVVQAGGRFIEQKNLGFHCQDGGQRYQTFFAT